MHKGRIGKKASWASTIKRDCTRPALLAAVEAFPAHLCLGESCCCAWREGNGGKFLAMSPLQGEKRQQGGLKSGRRANRKPAIVKAAGNIHECGSSHWKACHTCQKQALPPTHLPGSAPSAAHATALVARD